VTIDNAQAFELAVATRDLVALSAYEMRQGAKPDGPCWARADAAVQQYLASCAAQGVQVPPSTLRDGRLRRPGAGR
jgi:hypothetical protein